ncbi:ABC transporter permease [Dyadobacter psychrotolerans]|uniref:FtsX-like permease family protein n=1 Tax=Dyadobacter psychrotolerans TaxID=2541721 RepID=A0A4R5DM83_9BACT|nr:FtsX-like permease family protein [Dyadobacter psychrotolerans]TDE14587.1 FtsX-like permease family protein [Dyadobacter psychrotolerans]
MNTEGFNFPWLLKMAWRDSRKNRSRLFLFISSIILGIAALVAIYSLGDNLRQNIDDQAATLIGADLALSGNKAVEGKVKDLVDSLGVERSEERSFASMILFPKGGGNRLAQVKALEGNFPYYGELETIPVTAGKTFRNKKEALVDQTLMLQYQAKVGDSIKIGEVTFAIAGILQKAPGQTGLTSTVAPSVYIPMRYLNQTGLMQKGSRIAYRYYIKYAPKTNVESLVKNLEKRFEAADLDYRTVQSQKEDTGRSFKDLTRFLALVGFVALLLGCIGVASAIHIYIKEKINLIAILRCLGVKASQAFLIYLIQIVGIGIIGSVLGAILGTAIQQFLPVVIKDFLPFTLTTDVSWLAIGQGLAIGTLISILFSLPPLLSIRKVSPLNVLRASGESATIERDPVTWLLYALIVLFIFGFSFLQMRTWIEALVFTVSILGAFLVLFAMASLLMWLTRKFFPTSWSYLWRQGLANLYRPNNQTAILIVSIGLGTALICTLLFTQGILLTRVNLSTSGNQPNIVLFDIQSNQKEAVLALAKEQHVPVNQSVSIVNMRLEEVNGRGPSDFKKDTTDEQSARIFGREYRVTFRDSITSSEKITKGKWEGIYKNDGSLIPISLEQGFADRSRVKLGDTMVFNVQGTMMSTVVASLREVNWGEVQTNFLVVFPKGVLEEAPQFHVMLTHVPNPEASAKFQQSIVRQFPNISIIDLALVLRVLDDIFNKIGFVIRFMAGFSILTGIIVLIASVLISKYQRLQESVLLRTLGASRKQIFTITALEYFFLGSLASLTGIILAVAGSWSLAKFSFEAEFKPEIWPVAVVFFFVSLLTVLIGLINSRGILSKPPLEVLRQDV